MDDLNFFTYIKLKYPYNRMTYAAMAEFTSYTELNISLKQID